MTEPIRPDPRHPGTPDRTYPYASGQRWTTRCLAGSGW
ncbi:Uncharacterised protein [Amycolatopsis camponoti]|uniref:Uncharacterized protein n=1 Tax=Amycolatopsis camponoti TaxID=2606593 RepID=A0A6I8LYZ2_9PSEU|nr:Uncharacterised protein [Amycolatopsis camponoti]